MINTSCQNTIITNVYTFVKSQREKGVTPTQRMITFYLKSIYQQNRYLFGTAKWESVAGTFRSMISKAKKCGKRKSGLAMYVVVVCDKHGCNQFKLR